MHGSRGGKWTKWVQTSKDKIYIPGDVMDRMVTIVNNTSYLKVAKKRDCNNI